MKSRSVAVSLQPHTVQLVQSSWAKVRPIADAAANLFYNRLFELDPSARALFKQDMGQQKMKLMQTLNVAVDGLRNPDKLIPVLRDLGVRHHGYMVQAHHYDLVGQALLWTLREGLGDDFTAEVHNAWVEVYTLIAGVMKQAAGEHAQDNLPEMTINATPTAFANKRPAASSGKVPQVPRAAAPPPTPPPTPSAAGPLTARQIELTQASWAQVRPIADAAANLFYNRLFELDPSVRSMFKPDMTEQKKKLMQTLTIAVDGLRNPDKLLPVLRDLGARHAGYMVQPHHYDLVGEALLWTLGEGLGDDFTDEVKAAWIAVYGFVAGVMTQPAPAARPAPPAPTGPLDVSELELVETSWAQVRPIADAAATLFYDRLFQLSPETRSLFKSDMKEQKKKLMQTLNIAVEGLRTPDKLMPVLKDLGVRHHGYMVQEHHYDLVGEALLWALEEGLGDDFTDHHRAAWAKVYGLVADTMKRAAASLGAPAASAKPARTPAPASRPASPRPASSGPASAGAPAHVVASAQVQVPDGRALAAAGEDVTLNVHLVIDPSALQAPTRTRRRPKGSLAMALLLAVVCAAAVMTASSVLFISVAGLAEIANKVPTFLFYVPPLAAAILTFATFMLGYLWSERSSLIEGPADDA